MGVFGRALWMDSVSSSDNADVRHWHDACVQGVVDTAARCDVRDMAIAGAERCIASDVALMECLDSGPVLSLDDTRLP